MESCILTEGLNVQKTATNVGQQILEPQERGQELELDEHEWLWMCQASATLISYLLSPFSTQSISGYIRPPLAWTTATTLLVSLMRH